MSVDVFADGGEMGALMRSTDWSQSAFGGVHEWPQSLRTAGCEPAHPATAATAISPASELRRRTGRRC